MADEAQVRNLEELREHFDLVNVLSYYDNGRLVEWLTDRYYEDEAAQINALDSSAPDFKKCLCDILGVTYIACEADLINISDRNKRREVLKTFTADDKILAAVDSVAFSQEELADLLDAGVKTIYLCGERFKIPGSKNGLTYIGVNNPIVDAPKDYAEKNILFQNVDLGTENIIKRARETTDLVEAMNLWRIVAEQGNAEAQYHLGLCIIESDNQNYTEAKEWIRKAAEQGFSSAQNQLGVWEDDAEAALKWYLKAAEQGHEWAQYNLGQCYDYGSGVEADEKEAVKWYNKAAEQGNPEIQCNVGAVYYFGLNAVEQDYSEAVNWYRKAAEQGYAEAQFYLGICYLFGNGIKKNYEQGVEWCTKAGEQDNEYFYKLSSEYKSGVSDFEKSPEEAIKWCRKAAEKGNVNAQFELGESYLKGEGVRKDIDQGIMWCTKAAEQDANFALKLGNLYYDGKGSFFFGDAYIEIDYTEAVDWYRKAAEGGELDAYFALGKCYIEGNGVKKDIKNGINWYRKAAEKDSSYATRLAGIYKEGDRIEQDYEEAFYWYNIAAEDGKLSAMYELGLLYLLGNGIKQNYDKAYNLLLEVANDSGWHPSIADAKKLVDAYSKKEKIAEKWAFVNTQMTRAKKITEMEASTDKKREMFKKCEADIRSALEDLRELVGETSFLQNTTETALNSMSIDISIAWQEENEINPGDFMATVSSYIEKKGEESLVRLFEENEEIRNALNSLSDLADKMGRQCPVCEYFYNPKEGDLEYGIEPNTSWSDICKKYQHCPSCGIAELDEFTPVHILG